MFNLFIAEKKLKQYLIKYFLIQIDVKFLNNLQWYDLQKFFLDGRHKLIVGKEVLSSDNENEMSKNLSYGAILMKHAIYISSFKFRNAPDIGFPPSKTESVRFGDFLLGINSCERKVDIENLKINKETSFDDTTSINEENSFSDNVINEFSDNDDSDFSVDDNFGNILHLDFDSGPRRSPSPIGPGSKLELPTDSDEDEKNEDNSDTNQISPQNLDNNNNNNNNNNNLINENSNKNTEEEEILLPPKQVVNNNYGNNDDDIDISMSNKNSHKLNYVKYFGNNIEINNNDLLKNIFKSRYLDYINVDNHHNFWEKSLSETCLNLILQEYNLINNFSIKYYKTTYLQNDFDEKEIYQFLFSLYNFFIFYKYSNKYNLFKKYIVIDNNRLYADYLYAVIKKFFSNCNGNLNIFLKSLLLS